MDALINLVFGPSQNSVRPLTPVNQFEQAQQVQQVQQVQQHGATLGEMHQAITLISLLSQLGVSAALLSAYAPKILELRARNPRKAKLLCTVIALWFFLRSASSIKPRLQDFCLWMMSHGMASVSVPHSDTYLQPTVHKWLFTKALFKWDKTLFARSTVSLRNEGAKAPDEDTIVFEGESRMHMVWEDGRPFLLTRKASPVLNPNQSIRMWCLGWSPKPVQDLLLKLHEEERGQIVVRIHTPLRHDLRYEGGGKLFTWAERTSRPSRSLNSVYLDSAMKTKLVDDIDDYLAPDAASWYAERGIPYRKGYLFHGIAGSGKTSMATAIAGHYRLDIYMLSLLTPGINDSVLLELFQALRPGTVVLLEDIDSAGIGRQSTLLRTGLEKKARRAQPERESSEESEVSDENYFRDSNGNLVKANETPSHEKYPLHVREEHEEYESGYNPAEADWQAKQAKSTDKRRRHYKRKQRKIKSEVTLSGLLNAIDGASSPQGHILIMTSNKPEVLDEALVRPGRVDLKIKFEHASKEQIHDLFLHMYSWKDNERSARYDTSLIPDLAKMFAERVPAGKLTPAQLQQYVLMHRIRPQEAVDGVEEWIREELENKPEEVGPQTRGLQRLAGLAEEPAPLVSEWDAWPANSALFV